MPSQNESVIVQEVGMRDGLQSLSGIMPTDAKKRWIDAAYGAGVRYMEVASFVPAKLLPQMADAEQVIAHALSYPDLTVTALVPNLKGAEKALAAGVHRIVAPISVSAAHSMANVRKTPVEMVEEFRRIRELRDAGGKSKSVQLIAGLSTVFGCTFQGNVPLDDVRDIVLRVLDAGADLVALADTTGFATPGQVDRFFATLKPLAADKLAIAHFHDTRGMALANTVIALQHGIREFDASLAGIGGCPHAPGATGNVATEDLVFMLESMGYQTGIDVQQLLGMRPILEQALPQAALYGSLSRAGLPKGYPETQSSMHKVAACSKEHNQLPLKGVRVVELSHMVMGPTCGMILGDLGAEVIKVEPPHGDGTRGLIGTGAGFFRTFNRNKKSVALDMGSPEGREALIKLVDTADVFVENFKPGRMKDLGVDYESLRARNPKLIYVSHKGFLNGPYENRLALDEVVQMMAGLAYMTGPVGRPLRAGSSVNDIMGGMFGAIGVLAALYERQATGVGKEVQSALFENCVLLSAQHMHQYAATGVPAAPMPDRISAWAVYDVFELAKKEQMFIAATGDGQWRTLSRILGREDLLADPRLATNNQRVVAREWLLPTLRETLRGFDGKTLAVVLEQNGIPFAPITRPEDLFEDPHLLASGGLSKLTLDDGTQTDMPLLPFSLDGERLTPRMPIAKIGEHTYEIMRGLGYGDEQIAGLVKDDEQAA